MSMNESIRPIEATVLGTDRSLPTSGKWHLLHTKSRQEKLLADELHRMGVGYFLPLVTQARLYGNRKFKVELPLLPGYVFVRGSLEGAYQANGTHRVARVIEVADQTQLNWELANLHMALRNYVSLDPYPFLKKGVRVEVRSGPLRGLQGLVEHKATAGHLVLQVEMLGRALALEITPALLDPV